MFLCTYTHTSRKQCRQTARASRLQNPGLISTAYLEDWLVQLKGKKNCTTKLLFNLVRGNFVCCFQVPWSSASSRAFFPKGWVWENKFLRRWNITFANGVNLARVEPTKSRYQEIELKNHEIELLFFLSKLINQEIWLKIFYFWS